MWPESHFAVDARSVARLQRVTPEQRAKALAKLQEAYSRHFPPPAPPLDPDQRWLESDAFLIDSRELARRLGVSIHTVRRWRAERIGPPQLKLGQGKAAPIRFHWGVVLDWLKLACWIEPVDPPPDIGVRYDRRESARWQAVDALADAQPDEPLPTAEAIEAEWRAMGEELGPPRIPTAAELRSLIEPEPEPAPEPAPATLGEAIRASRARCEQAERERRLAAARARVEAAAGDGTTN